VTSVKDLRLWIWQRFCPIRQGRRQLGLSAEQLGYRIGRNQQGVSHWETGLRLPNRRSTFKIAMAIGRDPARLYAAMFTWRALRPNAEARRYNTRVRKHGVEDGVSSLPGPPKEGTVTEGTS
jgi:transcriptional regulator with XRE-family HTH domain